MEKSERTNYVYEFTYSSGPGSREIFECKYVQPDEALDRFKKILRLTEKPFDFKILVHDEATGEESSFQIRGSVDEMFEKFKVFLETSTGYEFRAKEAVQDSIPSEIEFDSMSNFEKMQMIIYASFKHGKFSSLDVAEIYESTFNDKMPKSTASTYLARMWDEGNGDLERYGNRTGYTYRLRTELNQVQSDIKKAERILSTFQIHSE